MKLEYDSNNFGQLTPNTFSLERIIEDVINITIIGWSKVIANKEVNINDIEPKIAGCLCRAMRKEKNNRPGLKNQIRIETEVGTLRSPESIEPEGRIDIKIIYSFDETEYFGMECKRISSTKPDRDLATKYVKNGILRFVEGIYSPGHDWGAMLGFVIDQKIDDNIKLVKKRINKYKNEVCLEENWTVDKNFSSIPNLYRTCHKQKSHHSLIDILHLFLQISYINKN